MAVYVDDMRARFRRMVLCHMIADTEEEIHAMADKIGVARRWYQGDHYDICQSKRALAVAYGAREITGRQLSAMAFNRRCRWPMGTPETAEGIARERRAAFARASG